MQCSSLGSLDEKWLFQEFSGSLLAQRLQGHAPARGTAGAAAEIRLVWPTVRQVQGSIEGWAAGG